MRNDRVHLLHIIHCIGRVEAYVVSGQDSFLGSTLIQDAMSRNLQVLCGPANRLSESSKAASPNTNWQGLRVFRNVAVHEDLSIDLGPVWSKVTDHPPVLKSEILSLLTIQEGRP